jgi:hypothetical protein
MSGTERDTQSQPAPQVDKADHEVYVYGIVPAADADKLPPIDGLDSAVAWIAEVIIDEAEREKAQQESPERALEEIAAALATGEITPEEAEARTRSSSASRSSRRMSNWVVATTRSLFGGSTWTFTASGDSSSTSAASTSARRASTALASSSPSCTRAV